MDRGEEVRGDESFTISEAALPEVQDHSAAWCRAGDLRKSQA